MKKSAIALVVAATAFPSISNAQVTLHAPSNIPNDGQILPCLTQICVDTVEAIKRMPPPVRNPNGVQACVAANRELGRWINESSYNITKRYDRRELSYDEAADIRSLYYTETFVIRDHFRSIISTGDVGQCREIRDRSIRLINTITRQSLGYRGQPTTEGRFHGR